LIYGNKITNLWPIVNLPLQEIECDYEPGRDDAALRSIKTLEKLNRKPIDESWRGGVKVRAKPVDEAWLKQIAELPPERQVDAVIGELMRRNPGDGGKAGHENEKSTVVAFRVVSDSVPALEPLRALTGLKILSCGGSAPGRSKLTDVSPLRGLPLEFLNVEATQVQDLMPLAKM